MKLVLAREFGDQVIWHLVPGVDHKIAVELRSEDQLEVRLIVVDLWTKDQASFESEQVDWWTSLQGFGPGGLIIKKFSDDQDPSKHQYFELTEKGDCTPIEGAATDTHNLVYPQFYQVGSESFSLVADYLSTQGLEITAGAEYTEWRDLIVVGYYRAVQNLLDRYLLVLDADGESLLHEKIDTGMQGVVFESFFTFTDNLVFVKERKELNVYRT